MVYYFTLRLYNRIHSNYRHDGQPITRQVSPIRSFYKKSITDGDISKVLPRVFKAPMLNGLQPSTQKNDLNAKSKLQLFSKNIGRDQQLFNGVGLNAFGNVNNKSLDRNYMR